MAVTARSRPSIAVRAAQVLAGLAVLASAAPFGPARAVDDVPDHLVVSEVVTGGASASDELIELYNPTAVPISLEGLELIYVSASGATVTRRAAWVAGAPSVAAAGHVLVANEAGLYAGIADAVYATGMAAAGGSVALRAAGATTAIDAVGWGTATSDWREGATAPAVAAGSSIERLPGGASGSTRDTGDNASDFVERLVPEPQSLASPPTPDPSATPGPTTGPTAEPTPPPSPSATAPATPSPTPSPAVAIASARSGPDGTEVTVEGISLTSSAFHDGGGFLADASAGIAVIVDGGGFDRGALIRATGALDDRFSQRTIRAAAEDIVRLGPAVEPPPVGVATGAVGEGVEGRLVRLDGILVTEGTALTSGTAFDVDDGSGVARVIVPTSSGIDLAGWERGASLSVAGVVGQRDSSGTGTAGYRVMPRDPADVLSVGGPASPAPTPTPVPTDEPPPSASPPPTDTPEGVSTIAEARAAPKNARIRVRGVVTLATGTVDAETAVIQDETGAIVLRLGDDAGALQLGQLVEAAGMRSTKAGMETLRVSEPPAQLRESTEPAPATIRTGEAGEDDEARLVVARGALVASARRASSGAVSFEIDDGSGPLRVSLGAALEADDEELVAGTWVEVRGVLGQETTGAQPQRGYRIWPRGADEITVVAPLTAAADALARSASRGAGGAAQSVGGLTGADAARSLHATLVVGPWEELGVGGVLWDGERVVAIDAESAARVTDLLADKTVPIAVEVRGPTAGSGTPLTGVTTIAPGDLLAGSGPVAPPTGALPSDATPTWVALVGRLNGDRFQVGASSASVDFRCDEDDHPTGLVAVSGIALGELGEIVVPCGGIRSAPALLRPTAVIRAQPARAEPLSANAAKAPGDPRRPLVAGLLVVAALVVVGAAIAARRLDPPGADPGRAVEPGVDEGGVEPQPPRLTLVRVPNEHGS